MSLTAVNAQELAQITQENERVVLKFTAVWCAPCKMLNPTLEKASESHPQVRFVEVDVEKEPDLAQAYQVRSIPAVFGLNKGSVAFQFVGNVPLSTLEAHLQAF